MNGPTEIAGVPVHRLANLFPMMPDNDIDELARDIKDNGLEQRITTLDGAILDGRNRAEALHRIGQSVDEHLVPFDGAAESALAFVISRNLRRRHLTESQRAMVADDLARLRDGQRADHAASIDAPAIPQSVAADMLSVSRPSVQRARAVNEKGVPELGQEVRSGNVSVAAAAEVAKLPPDEQKSLVTAGPHAVKAHARRGRKTSPKKSINPKTVVRKPTADELLRLISDAIDKITREQVEVRRQHMTTLRQFAEAALKRIEEWESRQ